MAANDPAFLVSKAEERYSDRLDEIAERIFSDREKRIVMLAGPSASGKTTTAGLIASRLNALDIALIDSCLEDIIKNGTTRLPHFDFVSGRRNGFSYPITLGKDDVLIVEGIHALNPVITDSLPNENLMKLYVSVSSRISDEDGDVLMSKRDLRFVRRLVRDYYHRASSVERTYDLWGSVQRGEDKYIFPYSHLAAEKIDSLHAYEPCVFRALAVPMLSGVGSGSEWYDEAQMMIERLERFEPLPVDVIPENSLLREFMD